MVGEEEREPVVPQFEQPSRQTLQGAAAKARGNLVQEEQPRPGGQSPGQFYQALLRQGQIPGPGVPLIRQPHQGEIIVGFRMGLFEGRVRLSSQPGAHEDGF